MKLLKMKRQARRAKTAGRVARPQDRLLFWMAAALAPESLPWYSGGFSRTVLGELEEARRQEAQRATLTATPLMVEAEGDMAELDAAEVNEAPRRAA